MRRGEKGSVPLTADKAHLPRYVPYGPVFRWSWNQMIQMPVQGSDLVWLLHAADEEGHSITETEQARAPKGK